MSEIEIGDRVELIKCWECINRHAKNPQPGSQGVVSKWYPKGDFDFYVAWDNEQCGDDVPFRFSELGTLVELVATDVDDFGLKIFKWVICESSGIWRRGS